MATLTVFKFDQSAGAKDSLNKLLDLQKQELIQVIDAATVTWPADKKKPKTEQLNSLTGAGAVTGGFWGLLFGLIFLVPWLGAAFGAAMGAMAGSLTDVGIDDDFIKEVREQVTPGTSALFVMSSNVVEDRVKDVFVGNSELIASNLTAAQEKALTALLADD